MEFLRTLVDALKLTFLILPPRPARRIGPRSYWLACVLVTLALALESYFATHPPRAFTLMGVQGAAFACLVSLLLAYVAAVVLRRPALLWPIASLVLATQLYIDLLIQTPIELWLLPATGLHPESQHHATVAIWIVMSVVVTKRIFDYLEPYRARVVRYGSGAALATLLLVPFYFVGTGMFFYTAFDPDIEPDVMTIEAEPYTFDPEHLMMRQDELVDSAVSALAPQQPGIVDLYVLAFGGDGSEEVFRNEAEYVDRLFAQRFGAAGRTLVLLNNKDTVDSHPLATRANLHRALRGIGRRIDAKEDVVLMFFTSPGSEDHELYVALDPLPLAQITPMDIASAIDEAALDWRVVIVSACYSGGFVPALADEHALVIAAARRDRTSFGCGADSDITYFGRAYFAEAMNRTGSFVEAFALAKARIREWETDEDKLQSYPQIATSPAIEAKLEAWMKKLELGPRVEFMNGVE